MLNCQHNSNLIWGDQVQRKNCFRVCFLSQTIKQQKTSFLSNSPQFLPLYYNKALPPTPYLHFYVRTNVKVDFAVVFSVETSQSLFLLGAPDRSIYGIISVMFNKGNILSLSLWDLYKCLAPTLASNLFFINIYSSLSFILLYLLSIVSFDYYLCMVYLIKHMSTELIYQHGKVACHSEPCLSKGRAT